MVELPRWTKGAPFKHYTNEFILADQGYVGCVHPRDTAITRADFMKDRIVIARTRIEHLFARLDACGFISNCRLSYETTTYAFDLIIAAPSAKCAPAVSKKKKNCFTKEKCTVST